MVALWGRKHASLIRECRDLLQHPSEVEMMKIYRFHGQALALSKVQCQLQRGDPLASPSEENSVNVLKINIVLQRIIIKYTIITCI